VQSVDLAQGTIRYRDRGSGPTLLFVHGLLVNGSLWRKVTPRLEDRFRCVVPDLPLGSHQPAMRREADLTPPGLARLVADFMEALELQDVSLIGNDTGGAISQLVATRHPQRLARLVLTPCDAFENFLPPMFRPLQYVARVPGGLTGAVAPLRIRRLRRLPNAFGGLTKRPVPDEVTDGWLGPFFSDRDVRRDTRRVLRGIDSSYTLEAAARLADFDRPTLIAWAPEDRFFKFEHGERLATIIPGARLEKIEDSYTFVSEDQPERTADLIGEFATAQAQAARSAK
jgi:pimeloyl-ACP methyl ester carboxylesterase